MSFLDSNPFIINMRIVKKTIFIVFFTMLIALPFSYKEVKISLLTILIGFAIINVRNYIITPIKKDMVYVFVFFITTNLIFSFMGVVNNNIGVWATFPVNVLWPIVYFCIFLDARFYLDFKDFEFLFKLSTAIILFYASLFYLGIVLGLSFPINENLVRISFDPSDPLATENQIMFPAVNSLCYITPFFLTQILLRNEKKITNYLFLLITIMLTLVTGKRATILLLIIAPLMIFCICFILPGRQWCIIKKISTNTAIFLLLISFSVITLHLNGIINIEFIANKTIKYLIPVDGSLERGAEIRNEQKEALINEWMKRPLLGSGFGAQVAYVRNSETPWAYELSYVAKLMNIGLIGISIYFTYLLYLFFSQIPYLKKDYPFFIGNMAGFFAIIIANSINPYLDSFEYMWMIYFQFLFLFIGDFRFKRVAAMQKVFR